MSDIKEVRDTYQSGYDRGFREGLHNGRCESRERIERLERELAEADEKNEKLKKQLVSCAYMFSFIRNECDWEDDERIGDACMKADQQLTELFKEAGDE